MDPRNELDKLQEKKKAKAPLHPNVMRWLAEKRVEEQRKYKRQKIKQTENLQPSIPVFIPPDLFPPAFHPLHTNSFYELGGEAHSGMIHNALELSPEFNTNAECDMASQAVLQDGELLSELDLPVLIPLPFFMNTNQSGVRQKASRLSSYTSQFIDDYLRQLALKFHPILHIISPANFNVEERYTNKILICPHLTASKNITSKAFEDIVIDVDNIESCVPIGKAPHAPLEVDINYLLSNIEIIFDKLLIINKRNPYDLPKELGLHMHVNDNHFVAAYLTFDVAQDKIIFSYFNSLKPRESEKHDYDEAIINCIQQKLSQFTNLFSVPYTFIENFQNNNIDCGPLSLAFLSLAFQKNAPSLPISSDEVYKFKAYFHHLADQNSKHLRKAQENIVKNASTILKQPINFVDDKKENNPGSFSSLTLD